MYVIVLKSTDGLISDAYFTNKADAERTKKILESVHLNVSGREIDPAFEKGSLGIRELFKA